MNTLTPEFLTYRIERPTLSRYVVHGSTPIPFFGNFNSSQVYTIGINPSHKEFLSNNGALPPKSEKRLSDFETLGINAVKGLHPIRSHHAIPIVDACLNYFKNRPYHWFNPLEKFVNYPLQASYYNDSACHLDLVQWATNPVWSVILKRDPVDARYLLEYDLPFLIDQLNWLRLSNDKLKYFFLSGKTVVESLTEVFRLELVGQTQAKDKTYQYSLYAGHFDNIKVFGTSMNVSDARTSNRHREYLSGWLTQQSQEGRD